MNDKPETSAPAKPSLSLTAVISAIGHPTRWIILMEMISGEPVMVKDLMKPTGLTSSGVIQHLNVLEWAGIVTVGPGHLRRLKKEFIVDNRHLDFGHCQLCLPEKADALK